MFQSEFKTFPLNYYKGALKDTRIRINGQRVQPQQKVNEGDVITHLVCRHEPPIVVAGGGGEGGGGVMTPRGGFEVAHVCKEYVVGVKSSLCPTTTSGSYRYNTFVEVLRGGYQGGIFKDGEGTEGKGGKRKRKKDRKRKREREREETEGGGGKEEEDGNRGKEDEQR